MVRTQIQLEPHQARRLKSIAKKRRVSMAEVIRLYVDRGLEGEQPSPAELYAQASNLIGRFPDRAGATDLAEEHDSYLEEAFT